MDDTSQSRQAFLDAERAKWLTVEEARYVLRTSRNAIFKMLASGLPHRREGRVIRIHVDALSDTRSGANHFELAAEPEAEKEPDLLTTLEQLIQKIRYQNVSVESTIATARGTRRGSRI